MTAHVEVAAKAWFDRQQSTRRDADRHRPDGRPWQWDDLTEQDREAYRALMAPVADAVAGLILADHMPRPTKTHVITEDFECGGCGQSWPCRTADDVTAAETLSDGWAEVRAEIVTPPKVPSKDAETTTATIEYVSRGTCLLCGDGVLETGEHIDPERHITEVERILTGRAGATTEDATQRLARAAFAVDSKHHFYSQGGRPTCACGFVGDARMRTQTEHITDAVLEEYDHD